MRGTRLWFVGVALAIGVFATTLTTLSLALMEWRGVTTNNVFVSSSHPDT